MRSDSAMSILLASRSQRLPQFQFAALWAKADPAHELNRLGIRIEGRTVLDSLFPSIQCWKLNVQGSMFNYQKFNTHCG
jgi:hypothetical protein